MAIKPIHKLGVHRLLGFVLETWCRSDQHHDRAIEKNEVREILVNFLNHKVLSDNPSRDFISKNEAKQKMQVFIEGVLKTPSFR